MVVIVLPQSLVSGEQKQHELCNMPWWYVSWAIFSSIARKSARCLVHGYPLSLQSPCQPQVGPRCASLICSFPVTCLNRPCDIVVISPCNEVKREWGEGILESLHPWVHLSVYLDFVQTSSWISTPCQPHLRTMSG